VGSLKEGNVVVVSYSGKEINAKLVYYGAGLSGKTTNLEAIYEAVPDSSRGKMVSMKTQSDRTLFFDLLPLDLGEIMGFRTRFLLYTVPGQVFYNATRKLVLKGADAIVFVADSEVGKMEENKESLANLKANLAEYKLSLDEIPWVMQYNKRDLPNVYTIEELNNELNPGGKVPFFEAVATQGKGVFETFRGISHLLMEKVTKDLRRAPGTPGAQVRSPEPPAAAPAPRPAAAAAPPPMAPARAMEREVQETDRSHPDSQMLEYGRQLDLPEEIPPSRPVPAHASAVRSPAPAPPRGLDAVAAPSKAAPPPAPPRAAPVAPPRAPVPAPAPAPAPPRAPAMAPAPARAPAPAAAPPPTPIHAAVQAAAGSPSTLVVPVTIPASGQTVELVIRIVLKPQE
jgi:signal recognition particle receptor subunit beta